MVLQSAAVSFCLRLTLNTGYLLKSRAYLDFGAVWRSIVLIASLLAGHA